MNHPPALSPRPACRRPSGAAQGLTLIELLVTLTLVAILMAAGAPAMQQFLAQRAVVAQADTLVSSLRLTRSEALKTGRPVTICLSTDTNNAAPTCAANAPGQGWASGWLVFVDENADGDVDNEDQRLRVEQGFANRSGGVASNPARVRVTFQPNGLATGFNSRFTFLPRMTGSQAEIDANTVIACLATTGRVEMRRRGVLAC